MIDKAFVLLDGSPFYRNQIYSDMRDIISISFFKKNPEKFYQILEDYLCAQRNEIQKYKRNLNSLIKSKKISKIITLNAFFEIDGENLEHYLFLFGRYNELICTKCGNTSNIKSSPLNYICTCDELMRPNMLLFNEIISQKIYNLASLNIANSNMVVVDNSFATLNPAKQLLNFIPSKSLSVYVGNPNNLEFDFTYFVDDDVDRLLGTL